MIFVDGLGLGVSDPEINPIFKADCPLLRRWLTRYATAVDAGLDTPGLPQSATGQATLFTGVNAAALMGRHMEGLPGPRLRALVEERNFLKALARRGYTVTFANAFFTHDIEEVRRRRRISVTTVAALSAVGTVRSQADLEAGHAVYHDLTREALCARGYTGPLLSPEVAAAHLLAIASTHDFTLFEFFETDRVAHHGDSVEIRAILRRLDRFLHALRPFLRRRRSLLILISDHGNVEDSRTHTHTPHPIPLVAFGCGARHLRNQVQRLQDFASALVELYPSRP